MKLQLISKFFISFFCLAVASQLQAQQDSVKSLPPITVTSLSTVNAKVSNAYRKAFPDATNARWYQLHKDFFVKFIRQDLDNSALFKKNGRMVYNIVYGYENALPDQSRKLIKDSYQDYDITRAINVKEANRDIWVVNLENNKKLLMVRIEDGELEEVGNYDKSL